MTTDLHTLRARLANCLPAPDADAAASALDRQTPGGDWPDVEYIDANRGAWAPRQHLERTRALALHARANDDPRHRAAALAGLAAWLRRDPESPNWWHNQIGNPRLLGEILFALRPHVPPELLAATRPLMARAAATSPWTSDPARPFAWTGANRLWISINRLLTGAVYGEEDLVAESITAALEEIRLSSADQEGIQTDHSFHQHGPLLHNGGYGASYLHDCRFLLDAVHGTRWQPAPRYHALLADFLLDGTRWMLRGEDHDPGCRDREITRPWASIKPYAEVARFLASAGLPRAAELREFADATARGAAPGPLAGNRMFHRSDFMVQQGPAACVSVRMHSLRTLRAECCNAEGKRSHHVADGMTCLMKLTVRRA